MAQLKSLPAKNDDTRWPPYLDPAFYWRASFKFKNGMHCPWRARFVDLPMHFGGFSLILNRPNCRELQLTRYRPFPFSLWYKLAQKTTAVHLKQSKRIVK